MSESLADIILDYLTNAVQSKETDKALSEKVRVLEAENAELKAKVTNGAWSDWSKYESGRTAELKSRVVELEKELTDRRSEMYKRHKKLDGDDVAAIILIVVIVVFFGLGWMAKGFFS